MGHASSNGGTTMGNSLPRTRLRAFLGASLCAALIAPAGAQADVDSWLFESPKFTPGNINGQDGWTKTGGYDFAVVTNPAPLQSEFGVQSLRGSNTTSSGSFGDHTFSDSVNDAAGESTSVGGGQANGVRQTRYVASLDFTSFDANFQPGLAIAVSPDRGDGSRMSFVRIRDTAGGLAVDASHVPSPATTGGSVDFVAVTDIATGLSRTAVHNLRIEMDLNEGVDNDVVRVFVDGTLAFTGESWENYYRNDTEQAGSGNKVPLIDNLLLRPSQTNPPGTAPELAALNGKGLVFDNVRVETFGGPNGPQGPTGSTGATGTQGAQGPTGPAGPAGPTGQTGQTGQTGSQGLPGAGAPQAPAETDNPVSIASGTLRASRAGVVRVPISCPADAGLCEGTVQLTSGRTSLGSKRFVLRGGRSSRISVRLSKSAQRRLKARSLKRARVSVFSRDLQGDATETVRTLSIR